MAAEATKRRVSPDEIQRHVGQRVTLRLAPEVQAESEVVGRITGVLDAADGLVVFLEPDGSLPDTRVSYHYHYVVEISPA